MISFLKKVWDYLVDWGDAVYKARRNNIVNRMY
jgi:hypothetical protein